MQPRCCSAWASFGVHYAEIGFAGANQFVSDLAGAMETIDTGGMKLALFGRTRGRAATIQDWPDANFMLRHKARIPVSVIVVKSRLLDVDKSLATSPEENLRMAARRSIISATRGLEVLVDLEHAMDAACGRRENGEPCEADLRDAFARLLPPARRPLRTPPVSRVVVCDTNGGASPEEVSSVFATLRSNWPAASFAFHGHTDRGLGVANSRAAILAGAVQVQGTLLGTGERCGNVNLTTVIGGMQLRDEASFVSAGFADRPYRARPLRLRRVPAGDTARRAHRRGRAHSAHGRACTAAASTRIPGHTSGAIRRASARGRVLASTRSRAARTLCCCRLRSACR